MNNYKNIIRQQLAEVRRDRIDRAHTKYYGCSVKTVKQMKRDADEYVKRSREFWSEVDDTDPCVFY